MWYEWLCVGSEQWTYVSCTDQIQPTENLSASVASRLFLIIPGNPGVCTFYEEFAECLQKRIPNCSVWVISHLNHVGRPPEIYKGSNDIILLNEQIEHKLNFILKFVPKQTELYLIGHSIGCYMILKLLQRLIVDYCYNVKRCFLLLPTIERMAETPNGRSFVKAAAWGLHYTPYLLTYAFRWLPEEVKKTLIRFRLRSLGNVALCIVDGAVYLLYPAACSNVIWMALDEMEKVKRLDIETLERFHDKITLVYGQTDDWCPLSFCSETEAIAKRSSLKTVICPPSVEHAFVMTSNATVADLLCNLLNC